jgi:WD40 repeat protein
VTATPEGVTVWEVASGRERLRYKVEAAVLAYWPTGRVLVAASGSDLVFLDLRADEEPGRLRGHAADVRLLAFTADGLLRVTGGEDGTTLVWDGTLLSPPPGEPREEALHDLWAEVAGASPRTVAPGPGAG